MYARFGDMWKGWTKNLYLLYGKELRRVLKACAGIWLLDVVPPVLLIALCLRMAVGGGGAGWILAAVGCFLLAMARSWGYSRDLQRLGFDARLALYQVPGATLFCLMLVNSTRVYRLSGRVAWKGRVYQIRDSKENLQ